MEKTYVVYICDLCFREIEDGTPHSVWFIDDIKHDVCIDCVNHFGDKHEEA